MVHQRPLIVGDFLIRSIIKKWIANDVTAIKAWLAVRPTPKPGHETLVFLRPDSKDCWHDDAKSYNAVTDAFSALDPPDGLTFRIFRHTFETVGNAARDQPTIDYVMGRNRYLNLMTSRADRRFKALQNLWWALNFSRASVGDSKSMMTGKIRSQESWPHCLFRSSKAESTHAVNAKRMPRVSSDASSTRQQRQLLSPHLVLELPIGQSMLRHCRRQRHK